MSATSAVITGGASGLGEACARQFAKQGITVWILDQNSERASAVAVEITADGGVAYAAEIDVTDRISLDKLATEIQAKPAAPTFLSLPPGSLNLSAQSSMRTWMRMIDFGQLITGAPSTPVAHLDD